MFVMAWLVIGGNVYVYVKAIIPLQLPWFCHLYIIFGMLLVIYGFILAAIMGCSSGLRRKKKD